MRLLLIEDDIMLGDALQSAMQINQYAVDWMKDAESAYRYLQHEHFDLMILDIGLPGMDGISLLKKIRREKNTIPTLILTARDSLSDKIAGLDAGADDYLLKPFELDELLARLRAISRRITGRADNLIQHGDLQLNLDTQEIAYQNKAVNLSRREYMILLKLLESPGRVFSREQLEQSLYTCVEDIESNTLEVHIHHLRKKIAPDFIRTQRGFGYVIDKLKPLNTSPNTP